MGCEAPDEGSGGGDVALGVTEVGQAASEPLVQDDQAVHHP